MKMFRNRSDHLKGERGSLKSYDKLQKSNNITKIGL